MGSQRAQITVKKSTFLENSTQYLINYILYFLPKLLIFYMSIGLIVRKVPVQTLACIYKIDTDCRNYIKIIKNLPENICHGKNSRILVVIYICMCFYTLKIDDLKNILMPPLLYKHIENHSLAL